MLQAQTFYESHSFYERHAALTWWFVMARIGQDLRERYQAPKELPAKLLALIKKLDAIESKSPRARTLIGTLDAMEGNYLKRCAPSVDPRSVGSMNSSLFVALIVIVLIVGS